MTRPTTLPAFVAGLALIGGGLVVGSGTAAGAAVVSASIAEIQGTDTATSPLSGDLVTTEGVVTAVYPGGGINGLYLQTEGTGGDHDATPGASDGIFVYGRNLDESRYAVGDLLQVTGPVSEYQGTTQLTPAADGVTPVIRPAEEPTALSLALPGNDAEREAHEGELLAPRGPFTVTNTYNLNVYAEIGLAAGTTPLVQPTEVEDAQTGDVAGVAAQNAARAVVLDDGATASFSSTSNRGTPLPWLSAENPIRVGAPVTFTGPVVLEYRYGAWRFQPTGQITGSGAGTATFANTRTAAPEQVGGDLRLATFNVLNYFSTTGAEYVASGMGQCTYHTDRAGNPITTKDCGPSGPRGAADAENLERQQAKIVRAINTLGADIVSLEEIENSVKFGKHRDQALVTLVAALNRDAGAGTWAYAGSPAADELPAPADEDVIRTAFIYRPSTVEPVGGSRVLIDETNFDNAREPLAQAFKAAGADDSDAFVVVANHFKSKGSGVDDGTGQGNANPDRIGQAHALAAFADEFARDRGIDAIFLAGDFNAYSMEDPMQVLYDDGYTAIESDTVDEETYSFKGLSGSLDHILGNEPAMALVTGADIWSINSGESLAFEYSRYNHNATNFYDGSVYRSSDHDPEIVGLRDPRAAAVLDGQATPQVIWAGETRVKLHLTVSGDGAVPTGRVEADVPGQQTLSGQLEDGSLNLRLAEFDAPGTYPVVVTYAGDGAHQRTTRTFDLVVVPRS